MLDLQFNSPFLPKVLHSYRRYHSLCRTWRSYKVFISTGQILKKMVSPCLMVLGWKMRARRASILNIIITTCTSEEQNCTSLHIMHLIKEVTTVETGDRLTPLDYKLLLFSIVPFDGHVSPTLSVPGPDLEEMPAAPIELNTVRSGASAEPSTTYRFSVSS